MICLHQCNHVIEFKCYTGHAWYQYLYWNCVFFSSKFEVEVFSLLKLFMQWSKGF